MELDGNPTPSNVLALLAFLLVVPGSLALAYLGHVRGYVAYEAIPFLLAGAVVAASAVLLVVLPRLAAWERRR